MKVVVLAVLFSLVLLAAPAREREHKFMQSSSETFVAKVRGDEHLHWIETPNSDILIYNKQSGNYDYAVIEGEELKPSNRAYKKGERRVRSIKADVLELWSKKKKNARLHLHRK